MTNRIGIISFFAGVLFAVGLALSGMTSPARVIGFLDVTGAWDGTLLFVMGGALAVYFALSRATLARTAPVLGDRFVLPTKSAIDARLVVGAALFGAGWGIAGICPGPAITSLVTGGPAIAVFVVAMAGGMYLQDLSSRAFAASKKRARSLGTFATETA